jgi:hypothetical protein
MIIIFVVKKLFFSKLQKVGFKFIKIFVAIFNPPYENFEKNFDEQNNLFKFLEQEN